MNAPIVSLLVCGLGGEGGGVLSEWLYGVASACGHAAQATSVPGVAQRTGATTYYVEICSLPDAQLGGRTPVFCLNPVPGAIDLLASSELLETARQIGMGMATAERTTVLSSNARALTVAEKMQLGDGRFPQEQLLAALQRHSRAHELFDMGALAREAGTVISAVLFGAIAALGLLPFPRSAFEETIRRAGKGAQASLKGFALGFDAVAQRREQRAAVERLLAPVAAPVLPAEWAARFPAPLHTLLGLAHARLVEYQDAAYAAQYAERLARIVEAERAADPTGAAGFAASLEAARWLALWMAFDDIVRVAELKLRAGRHARVRREVGAREDEIVKIIDHFKPGVPEIAGLLPDALARRLLERDARRRARGLPAWAMPLKLRSSTVGGALALRLLASAKRLRRFGHRFALEQTAIESWLAALEGGLREHAPLGLEIARCGRLIKGYGATNERGKRNLLHVVEQLARAPRPAAERAEAIRAAREAALADEAGTALDRALVAHGAQARPLAAQPLRFYRRRPDMPAPGITPRP
ncbi:MAG: indolepyruvate oxidoreductase subunit beta family protein [Proteobacteria bacterium]|nr:indolepyruvate oxidoreductase subunit beta family protein [Pseudomonadota bacterium]